MPLLTFFKIIFMWKQMIWPLYSNATSVMCWFIHAAVFLGKGCSTLWQNGKLCMPRVYFHFDFTTQWRNGRRAYQLMGEVNIGVRLTHRERRDVTSEQFSWELWERSWVGVTVWRAARVPVDLTLPDMLVTLKFVNGREVPSRMSFIQ